VVGCWVGWTVTTVGVTPVVLRRSDGKTRLRRILRWSSSRAQRGGLGPALEEAVEVHGSREQDVRSVIAGDWNSSKMSDGCQVMEARWKICGSKGDKTKGRLWSRLE
jgi:hypothetical protein